MSGAHWIVALGAVVLLVLPLAPPAELRSTLWAFEPLRELSLPWRVLLVALLSATLMPGIRARFTSLAQALGQSARVRGAAWAMALPSLFAAFVALRQRNLRLGDGAMLTQWVELRVHTVGHQVTYDEPLELYFHSLAYRVLHAAFDWDVAASYGLLSALAGLAFILLLVALWRDAAAESGAPLTALAIGLSLATPSVQLFFGYVENYSLVAVASLGYALVALRSLERGLSPLWPAAALGLAISFHVLAGWLGPSLLFVFWHHAASRTPAGRVALLAQMGAVSLVPVGLTVAAMTAVGVPVAALGETHLAALKFIFLVPPEAPYFVYPAFSAAHWRDIVNQIALTSLAPLALIAVVARRLPAGIWRRDARLGFFAWAAGFLHVFGLVWNAENGAALDWDLFALTGFFDALLAARCLQCAEFARGDEARLQRGLPALALGVSLALGFVVSNAVRTLEIPSGHARAHLQAGLKLDAEGSPAAAQEFDRALELDPNDPEISLRVGVRWWNAGERERARPLLLGFLEQRPEDARSAALRALLQPDVGSEVRP